jgi:hypothetical protein
MPRTPSRTLVPFQQPTDAIARALAQTKGDRPLRPSRDRVHVAVLQALDSLRGHTSLRPGRWQDNITTDSVRRYVRAFGHAPAETFERLNAIDRGGKLQILTPCTAPARFRCACDYCVFDEMAAACDLQSVPELFAAAGQWAKTQTGRVGGLTRAAQQSPWAAIVAPATVRRWLLAQSTLPTMGTVNGRTVQPWLEGLDQLTHQRDELCWRGGFGCAEPDATLCGQVRDCDWCLMLAIASEFGYLTDVGRIDIGGWLKAVQQWALWNPTTEARER